MEGFESLHEYIHSGELEDLADVIPHEEPADYSAIDFVQDHAIPTVGNEEDRETDIVQQENLDDDIEQSSKRFKNDYDSFDNNRNNEFETQSANAPGIPSLLNLNLPPPRQNQEDQNDSNQNASKKSIALSKDRRESRRQGSRWSSSRRQ